MKGLLILVAIMQGVIAYGMFTGFPFDGWLGIGGGILLTLSALFTLREIFAAAPRASNSPHGEM